MQALLTTLEAGNVIRYHATPHVKPQTVAEHTWGVAVIYTYIKNLIGHERVDASHVLLHDCAELFTGDVPFTLKRDHPTIKQLFDQVEEYYAENLMVPQFNDFPENKLIMKVADYVEGLIYCSKHERPIKGVRPVMDNYAEGISRVWCARDQEFHDTEAEVLIDSFIENILTEFGLEEVLPGCEGSSDYEDDLICGATPEYVNQ